MCAASCLTAKLLNFSLQRYRNVNHLRLERLRIAYLEIGELRQGATAFVSRAALTLVEHRAQHVQAMPDEA
jgi:hypothetical protein